MTQIDIEKRVEGVYFIQNWAGYINIGNSVKIHSRLGHYRSHNALPIWLVGYIPTTDGVGEEKYQHKMWGEFCVDGEWYAPTKLLVRYIKSFSDGIGMSMENLPNECKSCHYRTIEHQDNYKWSKIADDNLSEM